MVASKNKKRGFRRHSVIIIVGSFILTVVIVLILSVFYTPASYQPAARPQGGQVSPYLTHTLGPEFFNQVQLDKPFRLVVEQAGLNEILTSQSQPLTTGGFTLDSPAVQITPSTVKLMAQADYSDLSCILSIKSRPAMTSDGKLNLNIDSVNLGVIPITSLAANLARNYAQEYIVSDSDPSIAPIVEGILNNQPFEPVFRISGYTIRLKELTLENGKIILLLVPEPTPAAKSHSIGIQAVFP